METQSKETAPPQRDDKLPVGKALEKAGVVDVEDTMFLTPEQVQEINRMAKNANMPRVNPDRDFYKVDMAGLRYMPSPECWTKIRMIYTVGVESGNIQIHMLGDREYYVYQARGWRLVNGVKLPGVGTKTLNMAAKEEYKRIQADVKLKRGDFTGQKAADMWAKSEILRIRNFGPECCETGALNRLTRFLTGFSSGLKDDAEKNLMVSEAELAQSLSAGDPVVSEEKAKLVQVLNIKASKLKDTQGYKKMLFERYKVTTSNDLPLEVLKREIAELVKQEKALAAAPEKEKKR